MNANALAEFAAAYLNDFFLQVLKAVATLCWLLEKVAAGCMRFLTETNLWELLLQGTLETLRNSMPAILRSVFFGGGSGAGLMYVALMLAGLFMVIPALNSSRLVDPARVILWGIVVGALFIGSVGGYDLVGYVEGLRQSMTTTILQGMGGEDADLDQLVQVPMYATDSETEDYRFALPEQFETHYFSAPDPDSDYTTYTLVLGVWPVQHTWSFLVESPASQFERKNDAQTGLTVALLTLMPGAVLFLFGLIYAALAAAALVLILFFLVSLPVGFFEFGTTLLTGIVRQYVYLFAVTLLTVTLVAVMVASGQLNMNEASPSDAPNVLMTRVPILLVVTLALSYVSSMATSAMRDTFGVVSNSVRASMAPLNTGGRMPVGSGVLSDVAQAALNVSGSAALAGMTGGAGMALMAGAGAAVSSVSTGGGRAAATLAQGMAPDSGYASVFASAARSGKGGVSGMAYTASQAARSTRNQRQRHAERATASVVTPTTATGTSNSTGTSGLTDATGAPEDRADYAWDGTSAGTFKLADSALVTEGMQAFRDGEKGVARDAFTRAFGSRQVAEQVVTRLSATPRQAELPLEAMTTQIARSAHATVRAGKPLFDKSGALSPAFQATLAQHLKGNKQLQQVNLQDPQQRELVGALAGASVRPLSPLWLDPRATQKLAQTVLDPDEPQVATGDTSALLSLQGLAHIEGWQQPHLEAIFEATRSGQSRAALSHGNPVKGITEEMGTYQELRTLDRRTATEAARLALLITRQAQGIGGPGTPGAGAGNDSPPPTGAAGGQGTPETPEPEGSPSSTAGTAQDTQSRASASSPPPAPARSPATTRRLPAPNLLGGGTAPLPASSHRAEAGTAPLRAVPGTHPRVPAGPESTPPADTTPVPHAAGEETTARTTTSRRRVRRGRRQED